MLVVFKRLSWCFGRFPLQTDSRTRQHTRSDDEGVLNVCFTSHGQFYDASRRCTVVRLARA